LFVKVPDELVTSIPLPTYCVPVESFPCVMTNPLSVAVAGSPESSVTAATAAGA
jgi:hypothetical protein